MELAQEYDEAISLRKIRQHPRNPRKGDDEAVGESIDANGWFGAVLVHRSTGHVIAGNTRFRAMRKRKAKTVPGFWVDCDDDTALRILLVDNRTSDMASYDDAELLALLVELEAEAAGLIGTGYTDADLAALLVEQEANAGVGESARDSDPVPDEQVDDLLARAHGLTMDQALSLAPDDIDGFDWLLDRYVRVHDRFADRMWGIIELDQGGADRKRETRAHLRSLGINPIPVYHPMLDGWEYFDELASTNDRICFGNVVQASVPMRHRLLMTAYERKRAYPHLWIHLLGYGSRTPDSTIGRTHPTRAPTCATGTATCSTSRRRCRCCTMIARSSFTTCSTSARCSPPRTRLRGSSPGRRASTWRSLSLST